jgi:hypothetical protein
MLELTDFGNGLRAHLRLEVPEALPEPAPVATEEELTERLHFLALAQAALEDRERAVAAREHAVAEEASRLAVLRAELTAAGPGTNARAVLRERVEQQAEYVWRIFEEALGAPDQATRIAAARALLAEAYGDER